MKIQKAVLTETKHIAIGVLIGDAVMCGVFAALKKFDYTVPLGALLGTVFGICSMANSTLRPGLTAFVFSPFVSAGLFGFSGILRSIVIALIPRILVGVVAGLLGSFLRRKAGGRKWYFLPGLAGSFTNTVLVMTGIYLLYGPAYAAALGKSYSALLLYIFGVVGVNGTCEAVLAAVVTAAAVPALLKAGD